ncbi:MAG TPA: carbohydrate porin [Methyloceanibacter sp.]|nr:carbohydrate porin [Methyloceanibacter sp.]
MTNDRIAPSDLSRRHLSSTVEIERPARTLRSKLAKVAGVASMLVLSLTALPSLASAACDLSEADIVHGAPGIPEGAIMAIDPGGVRGELAKHGIEVGGAYYGEAFYDWGGIKDGGAYDGVLELYLNADMQKLGLWQGLCFHTDGYQIHGRSITGENVGGLMPVSSLEAEPSTRLFELWLEQHMFNDTVAVKIGQLAADSEFFFAEGGGYFLNGTWGWAPIAAENNPNGGPAYPLATPGVRVAVAPTDKLSMMLGLYNGDPAPQCNKAGGDPQRCNDHGLDFELDDDPLLLAEAAYHYDLAGGRLPGAIKLGGWNHFGSFEHQRVDVGGELIAVTGNGGKPLENDWALYGIIDQLVWRKPGSEDPQGVSIFTRFAGAPDDRNLVDFYFDAGFTFTGMIPGRPNDALAIGFAYTGISDEASAFDVDSGEPVARNYGSLVEIAYTFEISQGWILQPDFQYFWNPGGGVVGVDDAAVLGARTTLTF